MAIIVSDINHLSPRAKLSGDVVLGKNGLVQGTKIATTAEKIFHTIEDNGSAALFSSPFLEEAVETGLGVGVQDIVLKGEVHLQVTDGVTCGKESKNDQKLRVYLFISPLIVLGKKKN